jgi:dihydrofolate reductase
MLKKRLYTEGSLKCICEFIRTRICEFIRTRNCKFICKKKRIHKMKINLIAAMSDNRVIGLKGRLPWGHLPKDWEHLFRVTDGIPMIMGRKSYDTPDRVASPNAMNIVVTSQLDFPLEAGFERAGSLDIALQIIDNQSIEEVFVIGGGTIFEQIIHRADKIFLTVVHAEFEGDAFFPTFSEADFKLIKQDIFEADERHKYPFSILIYERI